MSYFQASFSAPHDLKHIALQICVALTENEPRKGFLKPEVYQKLLLELPKETSISFRCRRPSVCFEILYGERSIKPTLFIRPISLTNGDRLWSLIFDIERIARKLREF